jgi:hypothetical protein
LRERRAVVDARTDERPGREDGDGDATGDEVEVMSLSESQIERLVEWDEKGTFED